MCACVYLYMQYISNYVLLTAGHVNFFLELAQDSIQGSRWCDDTQHNGIQHNDTEHNNKTELSIMTF